MTYDKIRKNPVQFLSLTDFLPFKGLKPFYLRSNINGMNIIPVIPSKGNSGKEYPMDEKAAYCH
jgi:hypothetical protein